ncbi:hypothetical protein SAMN05192574_101379 [Mucilaginibacter gossypiicola]|uniref:Uncharacterized protein n=1 Tax=Mucilaginibacter gossypiicola TaxID=551995 RepID=A0A1H8A8R3_9SPHI|nr:hypothetical protein [Mucilaginibacter gossypiicola]SEM66179.1 hypothetical protein SAMN05192574_101379 [Mucilaginibacter gossypiicola]
MKKIYILVSAALTLMFSCQKQSIPIKHKLLYVDSTTVKIILTDDLPGYFNEVVLFEDLKIVKNIPGWADLKKGDTVFIKYNFKQKTPYSFIVSKLGRDDSFSMDNDFWLDFKGDSIIHNPPFIKYQQDTTHKSVTY